MFGAGSRDQPVALSQDGQISEMIEARWKQMKKTKRNGGKTEDYANHGESRIVTWKVVLQWPIIHIIFVRDELTSAQH